MDKKESAIPPLTEEQAKALLTPHEIVRDPVHHDIWITALERAIIDTPAFQRLRLLSQLGPTHLVYPGAVHNRFMHSIGTLHCAELLVQVANQNEATYSQACLIPVEVYPHLLIRLCALVHDLAHIPFGHTLENEGNLAPGEWKDVARANLWLGDDSELSVAPVILKFLVDSRIDKAAAEQVVEDIRKHILPQGDQMAVDYPFVTDLVGNTLCADLLDYLDRDMFFCGLHEKSGDRVVKYMAVVRVTPAPQGSTADSEPEEFLPSDDPAKGKGRAVLLAYRFERQHLADGGLKFVPKSEIFSEAIDLLRRRFALAEKVYFHRTKLAASAMLISAMGSASFNLDEVYSASDGGFLSKLRADSSSRVKRLVAAYEGRRLYKPIYRLNYREPSEADEQSIILWREKYPQFRDPKWRKRAEESLEAYSDLPAGSIAIYCPDREMNLKEFEMLVQSRWGGEIKRLEDLLDRNRKLEMAAINERFRQLWSLQVFVDPELMDPSLFGNEAVQNLNAICEYVIDFPNDIPELQVKGRPLREQLADRLIQEWEDAKKGVVPHAVYKELVQTPHRPEGHELVEVLRKQLRASMLPEQLRMDTEQDKK